MTKYFGGLNFSADKTFRQPVRFSVVLSAEILSDKVSFLTKILIIYDYKNMWSNHVIRVGMSPLITFNCYVFCLCEFCECLIVCLSLDWYVYWYVYFCLCLCLWLSVCMCVWLSLCLSGVCVRDCLYECVSVCGCLCWEVFVSEKEGYVTKRSIPTLWAFEQLRYIYMPTFQSINQ